MDHLLISNEVLFFIVTIIDLSLVLLAARFGKTWLYAIIIANVILVSTFAAKLIPIFGLVTNVSNTFYAAIFIATDIISEHHGKKAAFKSIWLGFAGLVVFMILGQFALLFSTVADTETVSAAMDTLFAAVPRIAVASFVAYAISQSLDIWIFDKIRNSTGDGKLWFRNLGSTLLAQLVDSVIFFTLAFAGTVPVETLIVIILTGYIVKAVVALMDTPFMYWSYPIMGKKRPEKQVTP